VLERFNEFLKTPLGPVTVDKLLGALLILMAGWALVRLVERFADRALRRARVERSLFTFVKSAIKIALYSIAALMAAGALGIPVTSLVALLGVAGLAVSLSVQNTLMNLMGGLLVLSTKPFIVGDYISTGGAEGTVLDVGLIYTQIATFDDKIVFLPNGALSSGQIVNYTRTRKRRLDMTFSATPDADPEAVKALILEQLLDPRVIPEPAPLVRVGGYGEGSVQYVVRAWVATADYWNLFYDLNERVGKAFRDAGVRMPGKRYDIQLNDSAPKP
jgi:small conductance mechanosensitive channel